MLGRVCSGVKLQGDHAVVCGECDSRHRSARLLLGLYNWPRCSAITMDSSSHDILQAQSPATSEPNDVERVQALARAKGQVLEQLRRRIVGQETAVDLLLVALFARGHGLLVGVPGLAKTSLVSSLAQTLSLESNRIQFTPDLMPSDITGTDVLEQDVNTGARSFRFLRGPIFTNILLADEINRTPPKTQAALLQAMEEQRVTASGTTHRI